MAQKTSSNSGPPAILWFRQDLRIADNPALHAATADGRPVVALYVLDTTDHPWQLGGASRWWLHHSLKSLQDELRRRYGVTLILRRGDPGSILPALARDTGAECVFWNRRYEPHAIAADSALKAALTASWRTGRSW